jgi:hypothetical protein
MLSRCYNKKVHLIQTTYKEAIVCEEWHNFQVFAEWFENNYKEDWQLDKDILVKGNKIYSPETCCFVPQEINLTLGTKVGKKSTLPVGVHLHIKTGKYKTQIHKNNKVYHIGLFNTPEEAFQAYKTEKEKHIKEVADKWKGKITIDCYRALLKTKL